MGSDAPGATSVTSERAETGGRARWIAALIGIFSVALALRGWSIDHGLPYSYNLDEDGHFAPVAVNTVLSGWNPHYFENPPAFSYLLRLVFQAGWGKGGLVVQWANDPSPMLLAARWTSAVLGALACVLTAVAGARLLGRAVGLVAGALLAVACLPVFYGHLALNDGPAVAAIALSLVGVAGIARDRSRLLDWALAGVGIGLAASTKYTAGVVAVAMLVVALPALRESLRGLAVGVAAAAAAFVITNPYALLSFGEFREGLSRQGDFSSQKLIGLWTSNPLVYYGDVAIWGFGLLPLVAAGVGYVLLARADRLRAAVLAGPPAALFVFLSINLVTTGEGQMYSRWLLPAFPFLAIAAGFGAVAIAVRSARRGGGRAGIGTRIAAAALLVAMVGQGVFLSARSNSVLGRTDTRQQLRDWMTANVPRESKVVIEAFSLPLAWYRNPAWSEPRLAGPAGRIWNTAGPFITALSPGRIEAFRAEGRCLLVVTSNIRGRSVVEPGSVPRAVGFYASLDRQSRAVFSASPLRGGGMPGFDFDRSYMYFDGANERPGPYVEVRRLDRCIQRRAPTGG